MRIKNCYSTVKFVLICLLIQFSIQAHAGFLRLSPNLEAETAENNPSLLQVIGSIENQGDEKALDVRIEEAKSGKILADLKDFGPGEKKDVLISVPESELGLQSEGSYVLPLRVLYKDTNKMAFSAAFVLSYFKKSSAGVLGRSSPITVGLEESKQKQNTVDVGLSGDFKLVLLNTSTEEVQAKLDFVTSKELELKATPSEFKMGPQSELRIDVTVSNKAGLVGSSYATYAIVSGQVGGSAFADYNAFLINVIANTPTSWAAAAVIALGLIFAGLGFVYWKKETANKGMVSVSGGGRVIEPEPLDNTSEDSRKL